MLSHLIDHIEGFLQHYYRFAAPAVAHPFLVNAQDLRDKLPPSAKVEEIIKLAGSVVYVSDPAPDGKDDGDAFLGLYLSEATCSTLGRDNPLDGIKDENLGAWLVAIEELSHFHLLMHRWQHERPVSHLELEWQGEMDKYLLTTHLITEQYGDHALRPLATRIFQDVHFLHAGPYEEANYQAARFWFKWIDHQGRATQLTQSRDLQQLLRKLYHLPWQEKMQCLDHGDFADVIWQRAS